MENMATLMTAGVYQCLLGLPFMLVWLVSGVMIVQRIENNRSAVFMALGGIALGVVELVAGLFGTAYAPFLIQQGMSMPNISLIFGVVGIVRTIVGAAAWGFVLAALLMALGKREASGRSPDRAADS